MVILFVATKTSEQSFPVVCGKWRTNTFSTSSATVFRSQKKNKQTNQTHRFQRIRHVSNQLEACAVLGMTMRRRSRVRFHFAVNILVNRLSSVSVARPAPRQRRVRCSSVQRRADGGCSRSRQPPAPAAAERTATSQRVLPVRIRGRTDGRTDGRMDHGDSS